nr:hypothetical protein Beed-S103_00009 [Bovine alphaherpesvirus 5]
MARSSAGPSGKPSSVCIRSSSAARGAGRGGGSANRAGDGPSGADPAAGGGPSRESSNASMASYGSMVPPPRRRNDGRARRPAIFMRARPPAPETTRLGSVCSNDKRLFLYRNSGARPKPRASKKPPPPFQRYGRARPPRGRPSPPAGGGALPPAGAGAAGRWARAARMSLAAARSPAPSHTRMRIAADFSMRSRRSLHFGGSESQTLAAACRAYSAATSETASQKIVRLYACVGPHQGALGVFGAALNASGRPDATAAAPGGARVRGGTAAAAAPAAPEEPRVAGLVAGASAAGAGRGGREDARLLKRRAGAAAAAGRSRSRPRAADGAAAAPGHERESRRRPSGPGLGSGPLDAAHSSSYTWSSESSS